MDTNWNIRLKDLKHVQVIAEHENVVLYRSMWRTYQEVCVKKIRVTTNNYKYVQREYDILKICAHPCVYQFYGGCVEISGNHEYVYLVFEYMENGNLLEYIRKQKVPFSQKCEMVRRIAIGMHYLYSRRPVHIIHRDFKPENILVNRHGEVKIADFGISKQLLSPTASPMDPFLTSENDDTCGILGTVRWSAPELLYPKEGEKYTHKSDIYSLGLLIYFVFTEKLPYWDECQHNGAKIAYAKHTNMRAFLDDLPHGVIREIVTACTERDPALRPDTPEVILQAI